MIYEQLGHMDRITTYKSRCHLKFGFLHVKALGLSKAKQGNN